MSLNSKTKMTSAMLLSLTTVGATVAAEKTEEKRPNIIFILSDDAGYADFGFQGSKQFRTPNLDKLASQGMIFDQIYTTDAVSGPSRAGLLTGRYQQRFGIEENPVKSLMSENSKYVGYDMGVSLDEKMIPDYLKTAGYKCAIFGKWHLGATDEYHPYERGFDNFVGFRSGGRSFYTLTPKEMTENEDNKMEYGFRRFKEPAKGEYVTDILSDAACDFVKESSDAPFFIYLSYNAVHAPLHIDPRDKDEFANIKDTKRRKLAAMALSMDRGIGRLMETLKSEGLDENTIIVFSNDNGGPNGTNTSNYPLRGMKGTFLEGGVRVPGVVWYPKEIKAKSRYKYPVSFLDMLPTFANLAGVDPAMMEASKLDGVDLMPYLKGENKERPHQTLYWKCENRGAVRDGDWKFMRFPDRPAELYDISKDCGEHKNLADKHPELMKKYYKMLFEWEMTLERPKWMLERFCEKRVMEQFYEQEEYKNPVEQR